MKTKRTVAIIVLASAVLLGALTPADSVTDQSGAKPVHCDEGQTLTQALETARAGDTLLVSGVCRERVTITTDRLTLDGQGSAVLDGGGGAPTQFSPIVTIRGARQVTMTGFTVQNSPGEGILVTGGAVLGLAATTVQGNAFIGLAVQDNSTAEVTDCTMQRNGHGIDVINSSVIVLRGNITVSNNVGFGADLGGRSVMEIRGAHVQANNNGIVGLAGANGHLVIYGFAQSQGSSITANNNGFAGIGLGSGFFEIFGQSVITAENNAVGLLAPNGGRLSDPFGRGTFRLKNNGIGMLFNAGSSALVCGARLTVENNGVGLFSDAGGTLTFVTDPGNGSTIQNNGVDVNLGFGTRATFGGITMGPITADPTVLTRTSAACP